MLSTNLSNYRDRPFILICGCTGTGKTKLSIQLAKWLNENGRIAEIVNADAMQVRFIHKQSAFNQLNFSKSTFFKLYKNLDIVTNKATDEEMQDIKHHLIGYIEPTNILNTVIDYKKKAIDIIGKFFNLNLEKNKFFCLHTFCLDRQFIKRK